MKTTTTNLYLTNKSAKGGKALILLIFSFGYKERNILGGKYRYLPLTYTTEISIDPTFWDKESQRVTKGHPEARRLNLRLELLENLIGDVYDNLVYENREITPTILRNIMDEKTGKREPVKINGNIIEFIRNEIEGYKKLGKFSEGTIDTYNTFIMQIEKFEKATNKKMTFDNLNDQLYKSFIDWLKKKGYSKRNKAGKKEKVDYSQNYMFYIRKTFKKFLNVAEKNGIKINFDFRAEEYVISQELVDNIFNDLSELKVIANLDLSDDLDLDITRDLFIISSFTALRHSDTSRLNEIKIQTDIVDEDIIDFIAVRTEKTGEIVKLPCFPIVKRIYEKYNGNFPVGFTNQAFNRMLKKIGLMAKLNQLINITHTRNGKSITVSYKKWELMASHVGRRNCITNLYRAGVPVPSLMKISGHKSTKDFMKYIKCADTQHLQLVYKIASEMMEQFEAA